MSNHSLVRHLKVSFLIEYVSCDWSILLDIRFQAAYEQLSNERNPGCFGYIGDYTTQLYGDYNKPFYGSLLNNQWTSWKFFRVVGEKFPKAWQRWTRAWSPTTLSWTSWANISTNGSCWDATHFCWWQLKDFLFSPRTLGKWSNLTSIFFRWVETTN